MTCNGKPVIVSFRLPCWWDEDEMIAEGLPTDLDVATRETLSVDPRTGEVGDWGCLDAMTYVGVQLEEPDLPLASLARLLRGIREGVREGVKALNEGRIRPWSEVKKELGLDDEEDAEAGQG